MISNKMGIDLNNHMNLELFSANLYLSMSASAHSMGLKGAANWFMIQYQEEMTHFFKFYNYLLDQDCKIKLNAVEAVPSDFSSLLDMFEKTLIHEQLITSEINKLMTEALKENDHATRIFLNWFVTEQLEEENNDRDIIAKLKLVGDNGQGLLLIDQELAQRVFVPPPAN